MLTIRLHCDGVLTAFQTNRVVSLILPGSDEFEYLSECPAIKSLGVFDVTGGESTDVDITAVTSRPENPYLQALLKLDEGRHEHGDSTGNTAYLDGARFICLYDGDSAFVLDAGAKLFEWPHST